MDRVIQAVLKNALEPEWKAVFEHGSYGFRPSFSSYDAMARLFSKEVNKLFSKRSESWFSMLISKDVLIPSLMVLF